MLSQAQLRQRRRAGLTTAYGGAFSLPAEVSAVVHPLARRVSRLPNPQVCASCAADLADAVHELVSTVIGWLAEIDAKARAEHLTHLDSAGKAQAVRLMVDLTQRPALPDIGSDALASGIWATHLVQMSQACSGELAGLLARARPPGDPQLRGVASRSERLCDMLRDVDTAARQLEIRIDRAEAAAAKRRRSQNSRAQTKRAQLRELGVAIP
ncbi:hypothetical protein MHOL44478_12960 [Mycobacterium holsaticum DSM 44478]|nr:hypothetical protein [Mycolicibacterium holsaticum DSM 44478 = JCM 12374]